MSQEGVIKFKIDHKNEKVLTKEDIGDINHYRQILFDKKLIGVYPSNHPKFPDTGFGNISKRINDKFIITGTQTGGKEELKPKDYALVTKFSIDNNKVVSKGKTMPSSETITHGSVYGTHKEIKVIMHAHSNEIWNNYKGLDLHSTRKDVKYGTPELAREIKRLFKDTNVKDERIFVIRGHEDGVVSFGDSFENALRPLLEAHSKVSP